MSDQPATNHTEPKPPRRQGRRRFFIIIALIVLAWAAVVFFRWEFRSQWWAYRLTQADSEDARQYYLTRLVAIEDRSLNALPRLLEDEDDQVRDMGLTVLQHCDSREAGMALIGAFDDDNPMIAARAAALLARREDAREFVPQVSTLLRHKEGLVPWSAAVALGRIGGSEAEIFLLDAVDHENPNVAAQVIESLGLLGSGTAIPIISESLKDDRLVTLPPASQQSALLAVGALQSSLTQQGIDPAGMAAALEDPQQVADVAARWLSILTVTTAPAEAQDSATAPATQPQPATASF